MINSTTGLLILYGLTKMGVWKSLMFEDGRLDYPTFNRSRKPLNLLCTSLESSVEVLSVQIKYACIASNLYDYIFPVSLDRKITSQFSFLSNMITKALV